MARNNPPAPVVTGPVFRLSVQSVTLAQIYETIFDYMAAAPVGTNLATMTQFLTNWIAVNQAPYAGCLSPQSSITTYIVQEVAIGTTPTLVSNTGGVPGTAGATALTGFVAAINTKYTALKGQHGRGRYYMPAIPNTFTTPAVDPNLLNAAGLAAYGTLRNNLILPVAAAATTWNLVVSTRPAKPNTLVARAAPVFSVTVQPVLGTVRRRREGRGI